MTAKSKEKKAKRPKRMNYKKAWQEMYATIFEAAWQPRNVTYPADYLLEMMITIGEAHGGPSMDEMQDGSAQPEVHAKDKDLHVGSPFQ